MAVNLPRAYSKYLDEAYKRKSLTARAFKGKYKVVGGTTKTFTISSIVPVQLKDYSGRKSVASGKANFGYEYEDANTDSQTVTASQDKSFGGHIDKADATFDKTGALDTKARMKAQVEQVVNPAMDKYNLNKLADGAGKTIVKALTKANAYEEFNNMMIVQTNNLVPHTGRVAFVTATAFGLLKLDPNFSVPSETTAKSRRTGNYGMIDGCEIIEVPDSYLPQDYTIVLTHEAAAAAPKHLVDYKQGEYTSEASGYFFNGRLVYDAFIFEKKKGAIVALKSK